jgi:hypothetical protein
MFLSFLFLFSHLFAIEGSFVPMGSHEVIQEMRVEVLDLRISNLQEKLHKLKADGYECDRRPTAYRCQKFMNPPQLHSSITVIPKRQEINFGPIQAQTPIADGDDFLQYLADQEVIIDGRTYVEASYIESSQIQKVTVGPESDEPVHFVIEKKGLSELHTYGMNKNRFSWTRYLVKVFYQENPQ